jgi:signal transduction histidine kinase
VELNQDHLGLHLQVTDNGNGFDPSTLPGGFGLQGIRGRIKRHQGVLQLTRLAKGMRVSVTFAPA